MRKKVPVLDTNIIIRFLTGDNKKQLDLIEKLFKQVNKRSLEIPDLVITEIVYVLLSFYKLSKKDVITKIDILLDFEKFKTNGKLLKKTLDFFENNNISFIDAYLCSLVYNKKNECLYSFDKKILNMKSIKVITP